jgi:hypothetical protein
MKRIALIAALSLSAPLAAWSQAAKPQAKPAPKAEAVAPKPEAAAPKAEAAAPKPQVAKAQVAHKSRRNEDARHCLELPSNTEIIKCAEAYL